MSIKSSNTNGVWFTNTWDALNRLATVTDLNIGTTTYGYDDLGNLQTVLYPNGVTNTWAYDAMNRLTNLVAQQTTNGVLASFAYQVGIAGNRTNLTETVNGNSHTYDWSYDQLYRLTNEQISGSGLPTGSVGYGMDEVGNRTHRTSTVTGVSGQTNSFTANDWLTSDGYDANGNTTNSVHGVDTYDYENRLVRRDNGTNVIEIAYDGDGHRVSKTVISGGTTNTVWYLVDDKNLTGYAQVLEEMELVNGELAATHVYSYGHDLIAQEQVMGEQWVLHFYGYDGHGSVRYLANEAGAVTDTYDYDAYGILIAQGTISQNPTPNTYLYTGEQWDPDLGMYFLRARYNNPQTGRFWTFDSYEGTTSDPLTLHKYLYCHGNPANGNDPTGRDWTPTEMLVVAAIAAPLSLELGSKLKNVVNHRITPPMSTAQRAKLDAARRIILRESTNTPASTDRPPPPIHAYFTAYFMRIILDPFMEIDGNDWASATMMGQWAGPGDVAIAGDLLDCDVRLVAACLIHEATHVNQGFPSEREAYQAESDALRAWGFTATNYVGARAQLGNPAFGSKTDNFLLNFIENSKRYKIEKPVFVP